MGYTERLQVINVALKGDTLQQRADIFLRNILLRQHVASFWSWFKNSQRKNCEKKSSAQSTFSATKIVAGNCLYAFQFIKPFISVHTNYFISLNTSGPFVQTRSLLLMLLLQSLYTYYSKFTRDSKIHTQYTFWVCFAWGTISGHVTQHIQKWGNKQKRAF